MIIQRFRQHREVPQMFQTRSCSTNEKKQELRFSLFDSGKSRGWVSQSFRKDTSIKVPLI